jgi:hypothetical protein
VTDDSVAVEHPLEPLIVPPITPIPGAVLCMKPRGMLTPQQAHTVDLYKRSSPDFAAMRALAIQNPEYR